MLDGGSGIFTRSLNSDIILQIGAVDIERHKLAEHIGVVVQVSSVAQHRSLWHDTVKQRPLIVIEPD